MLDIEPQKESCYDEKREADNYTVATRMLVHLDEIRKNETGTAESRITAGYRSKDHSEQGKDSAHDSKPCK